MKFLGEHLGTYYIGRVWLARGCSINPTLQTHLFPLVLFKTHPTNSHSDPFQENPKGKCTKNQVNNIVFPNVGHSCTLTHCNQSPWENVQKNQVEKSTKVNNILEAHAISSYL
jgi:hypothetical protein